MFIVACKLASVVVREGYSLVAVCGLFLSESTDPRAGASAVALHGTLVVAHRLSCSTTGGIFLD